MPIPIAIHSDAICPWCWVGKRCLDQALATFPPGTAVVTWHPFQLNPGMPTEGMPRAEYRRRKFGSLDHSRALDDRVTHIGAEFGLAFDLPGQARTPNTLNAHRLIRFAGQHGVQDAVVEALFGAYFSAGLDVGDVAVLTRIAATCGLDVAAVARYLASDDGVTEVREEDAAIRRQGVEGVPFFIIGDVRISGAQPVSTFISVLSNALAVAPDAAGDCGDGMCRA